MNGWIVIIAIVSGGISGTVLTDSPLITPSHGTTALYTPPPPPPAPQITIVRVKTRAEAEAQALGYYTNDTGAMWAADKLVAPSLFSWQSSRAAVVISPEGKVYRVERVEKKRKVVREVEESDGWETRWEVAP